MLEALKKFTARRCWLIAVTRKFEDKMLSSEELYKKWSKGLYEVLNNVEEKLKQ